MTFKEFFKGQKSRFFWLNIIAMVGVVVLLITVTLYGIDSYTHHGEKITVPSITGMNSSKAALPYDKSDEDSNHSSARHCRQRIAARRSG